MADRVDRAGRIVRLQHQLRRVEEARMREIERALEEIEAAQRDLVEALSGDQVLHGLFVAAAARRLRALSIEAEAMTREKELQAARLKERSVQVRGAERLAQSADREQQREASRRELAGVIEQTVARQATRLP
jgi:hypothetical protein